MILVKLLSTEKNANYTLIYNIWDCLCPYNLSVSLNFLIFFNMMGEQWYLNLAKILKFYFILWWRRLTIFLLTRAICISFSMDCIVISFSHLFPSGNSLIIDFSPSWCSSCWTGVVVPSESLVMGLCLTDLKMIECPRVQSPALLSLFHTLYLVSFWSI